jgi:hypothetical protein
MSSKLLYFLKYFIPFSILLFIAQYFTQKTILAKIQFELNVWNNYAFHIIGTLLIYVFLLFVNRNFADKTGFAFLTTSVLKMMAAVLFLLPLIQSQNEVIVDVLSFFIPYFLFLFVETFFAIRLINKIE